MNFSAYIATRYLMAKKSRNAINVITAVSVAGVAVGTMALIIVLSVFNGLEDMINRIFTVFDPDLRITVVEGKVFTPDSSKIYRLTQTPGIEAFSMTLEENSLLKYGERQYIATIKGVDENYSRVTDVENTITEGEFRLKSKGGRPETVVGTGVAEYLGLNINFITHLHIYVPRRKAGINPDPENAFNDRYILPSGIFQIEHEFDSKYFFVPLDFARELLEYNSEISSIDIRLNTKANPSAVQEKIKEIFGKDFLVQNRYEQKEIFYKVMRSERLAIFIILTLILIIASFNIIGSLTMLIIEKEKDIRILRSLGADNSLIRKIFLLEGWLISIIGAAAGIVSGFIICILQQKFGFIKLQGETLIMNAYPVVVKLKDFVAVPATVLLIGYLAAWYPVRYLSKKYLAEGVPGTAHHKAPKSSALIPAIIIIIAILTASCSGSGNRVKKKDIIPRNEFVNLLTDLYISDGLLSYPPVKNHFLQRDSILNYLDVVTAHGYRKEDVDKTVTYYFFHNPRKLEKIFDQVIARLSEMQSRLEAEEMAGYDTGLWNLRPNFNIPSDGARNKIWFNIPVKDTGTYTFTFDALVYPDDSSVGLKTHIFFWKADSTQEGYRIYWEPSYFICDGENHSYRISNKLTDPSITHITGWLIDHEPQVGNWNKHVKISMIRLVKEPIE